MRLLGQRETDWKPQSGEVGRRLSRSTGTAPPGVRAGSATRLTDAMIKMTRLYTYDRGTKRHGGWIRCLAGVALTLLVIFATACGTDTTGPVPDEPGGPDDPRPLMRSLLPCTVADVRGPTLCGRYEVREDRDAADGRTILLDVLVAQATSGPVERDPVVYFHGGPGGSSVENAFWVASLMAGARQQRDLVFIDQRGTGNSGKLSCEGVLPGGQGSLFGTHFPDDHIEACVSRLSLEADLREYTTDIAADDIDEVLSWLGYDDVNLFGASYGTRLALVFLRRHEDRVRSVLLNGVAPPNRGIHINGAANTDASIQWLLDDCGSDPVCAAAYPDLETDLGTLLARFDGGPVRVDVELDDGSTRLVDYSLGDFGYAIRRMLYDDSAFSIAPWIEESIDTGGWSGFPGYYLARTRWVGGSFGTGLHLSVICSEDIQFVPEAEVQAKTAGTRFGATLVRRYQDACSRWPTAPVPSSYRQAVVAGTPALIISGERDPVTPAAWGDEAAASLANSKHVVVPGGGHFPVSACIELIQNTFFVVGDPNAVSTSCVGS